MLYKLFARIIFISRIFKQTNNTALVSTRDSEETATDEKSTWVDPELRQGPSWKTLNKVNG